MNDEVVKAVISKEAIYCGKCNHKLAVVKGLRNGLGNGTIYLLCKHKSSGKVCKIVNEINL